MNSPSNSRWPSRIAAIVVTVGVAGYNAAQVLGDGGLRADEARDKAVEVMRDLDPNAAITNWQCPDDSISIDKGETTVCSALLSTHGASAVERFAIIGLGDDGYTIRLR